MKDASPMPMIHMRRAAAADDMPGHRQVDQQDGDVEGGEITQGIVQFCFSNFPEGVSFQ